VHFHAFLMITQKNEKLFHNNNLFFVLHCTQERAGRERMKKKMFQIRLIAVGDDEGEEER
jgi:hypothetical protein